MITEDFLELNDQFFDICEELKNKKIFLTGGTGFFGKWILQSFIYANQKYDLNSRITILTRDKKKFLEESRHEFNQVNIHFVEGDIRSFLFPKESFDLIIHASAQVNVSLTTFDLNDSISIIVDGTRRVLEFSRICNAKKMLFVSSGAAYGIQPSDVDYLKEEFPLAPDTMDIRSTYGEAKRMAELLCAIEARTGKLEVKVARCFTFVGPYFPLNSRFAICNFIRDVIFEKDIVIKGDGSPLRSYLYASDLTIWLWKILFFGRNCEIYNVGSDISISMKDLAYLVLSISGSKASVIIESEPTPNSKAQKYIPSIDKSKRELSLKVSVNLNEAIRKTLEWHKLNNAF